MLNRRQQALLALLVQSAEFQPVRGLAQQFGTSSRCIRYDLSVLEDYLGSSGPHLERHKARGVRVRVAEPERRRWLDQWDPAASGPVYHYSPEERLSVILAALLERESGVSANRLADQLGVSRRTVVGDLRRAEAWLARRQLQLIRATRGVRAAGSEAAWRQALAELMAPGAQPGPLAPLPEDEMALIRAATRAAVSMLPFELADVAVAGLVFHLAVAVQRLRLGHDIRMAPADLAELGRTPEFPVAAQLCHDLGSQLGLRFPADECGYVTLHLLGAKAAGYPAQLEPFAHLGDARLVPLVHHFIRAAGIRLGTDLTRDPDLFRGLLVHLRPALYRLRYGLRVVNPLREEIQTRYGSLLDAVAAAARPLAEALQVSITPDELAFLTMHVGASLERTGPARRAPRVLLVCGSGIGTARLLQTRLQRRLPDLQIVDVVPLSRLPEAQSRTSPDLIVSTIPLPRPGPSPPVILVSPFLTSADADRIRQTLPAVTAVIEERMHGPVLAEVLDARTIALDVTVGGWEEAVRTAGALLVGAGKVQPAYVDAMVETVRRIGPYIVIDRGVAMPHARPEDGVFSLGFSLLRLAVPVPFGHAANDPVRLVICLASPDAETHLRALSQLATLLSDAAARQTLETGTLDQILDLVGQMPDAN